MVTLYMLSLERPPVLIEYMIGKNGGKTGLIFATLEVRRVYEICVVLGLGLRFNSINQTKRALRVIRMLYLRNRAATKE